MKTVIAEWLLYLYDICIVLTQYYVHVYAMSSD